ncbi:MAG: hypothetical protein AAFV62_10680 [Pseudomonadota bacterium]
MSTLITKTVGPGGDVPDLAAGFALLPPDLITAGERWRFLLSASAPDPAGATLTALGDASHTVEVRAAPGQDLRDLHDSETTPYAAAPAKGAVIEAASGSAVSTASGTWLVLTGITLLSPETALDAAGTVIGSRCHLRGGGASVARLGPSSTLAASVIEQTGSGDGVEIGEGGSIERSTVYHRADPLVWSTGLRATGNATLANSVVAGFSTPVSGAWSASSGVNADDAGLNLVGPGTGSPSWGGTAQVAADAIQAPDGVSLASLCTDADGASRRVSLDYALDPAVPDYLFSLYVKPDPAVPHAAFLRFYVGSSFIRLLLDPTTGELTDFFGYTGTVLERQSVDVGGGWYRLSIRFANNGTDNGSFQLYPAFTESLSNTASAPTATGTMGLFAPYLAAGQGLGSVPVSANPPATPARLATLVQASDVLRAEENPETAEPLDLRAPLSDVLAGQGQGLEQGQSASSPAGFWGRADSGASAIGAFALTGDNPGFTSTLTHSQTLGEPSIEASAPPPPLVVSALAHSHTMGRSQAVPVVTGTLTARAPAIRTVVVPAPS